MAAGKIKTMAINQDTFPGSWIEPKWSRAELEKNAAYYAMRIVLGAEVRKSPRGQQDFTSIIFDGKEYVLHNDNFKSCMDLAGIFLGSLDSKNITHEFLRYSPDFILEGLKHLFSISSKEFSTPEGITKMLWLLHDNGPCGEYRSKLPFSYMKAFHADKFYCENSEYVSESSLNWFDAIIMHRWPSQNLLSVFQVMKSCGKTMVYEFDDDIFNVPEWNVNHKHITNQMISNAREAIEIADVVIASTDNLANIAKHRNVFVGPNMISTKKINKRFKCSRVLDKKISGYYPDIKPNGRFDFYVSNSSTPIAKNRIDESNYNPIRILWTGSNTHDEDLAPIKDAILSTGKKYGIAIRFVFFGYCPPEFLEVVTDNGNANPRYAVKQEYMHFISYIEPTSFQNYYKVIETIDPDFALCPLSSHQFNMSKSNLKLIELGAMGVPCIATDFGPYSTDFDFPVISISSSNDTEAWINSISTLIEDSETRKFLSHRAYAEATQNYSWDCESNNTRKWDSIFSEIHKITTERKLNVNRRIIRKSDSTVHNESSIP
jgi:glycosyltransferase involved in cell wall biosynthesis